MKMKIINFLKKKYIPLLLLSLFFFHGIANYFWIDNNNTYYGTDEYYHLTFSIKIYRILFSDENNFNFVKNPVFYTRPLIPLITGAFLYPIFGIDTKVAIMTNIFFLGILIFSVYGIGKRIYNKNTGLFAAFLTTMYPAIFCSLRYYTYFIGLTALVSLSIYLLLLSNKFKNRKHSLLFGLCSGIGMLINMYFVIFIIGSVLYVAISSLKNRSRKEKVKITSNVIIVLLLCFFIAGIWYSYSIVKYGYFSSYPNISKTIFSVFSHFKNIYHYPHFVLFSFIYYIEKIVNYLIFLPFFILLCIGLFFYIKSKNKNNLLFLWLIIPYLVFTIIYQKNPTYIIPILPVIAIFSVFWIFEIKIKTLQKCIIFSILMCGFIQFFIVSYTIFLSNLEIAGFKIESYTNPPSKLNWNEKAILMYMVENNEKYPVKAVFLVPPISESYSIYGDTKLIHSSVFFNPLTFTYYSLLHELPVKIYLIWNSSEVYVIVSETDFLIVKSDYQTIEEVNRSITIFNSNNFHPVKVFDLPDNNKIIIFKR